MLACISNKTLIKKKDLCISSTRRRKSKEDALLICCPDVYAPFVFDVVTNYTVAVTV